MSNKIGNVGSYSVSWDSSSGNVSVGGEQAGNASSQAGAMEVARDYAGGGFLSGAFGSSGSGGNSGGSSNNGDQKK